MTQRASRRNAAVSLSFLFLRTGQFAIDNFARAARGIFPDANAFHMITAGVTGKISIERMHVAGRP